MRLEMVGLADDLSVRPLKAAKRQMGRFDICEAMFMRTMSQNLSLTNICGIEQYACSQYSHV